MNRHFSRILKVPICKQSRVSYFKATKCNRSQAFVLPVSSIKMNFLKNIGTAIKTSVTSSGLEKPEYEVINKHETYEERRYAPSKWVSVKFESMTAKDASRKTFFMLFDYIQGKNSTATTIDMTAPVATFIQPGAGPNCKSTFIMSFFVPPCHSKDTPEPSNPDVFLQEWPEMTVFARQYPGFTNEERWIGEARELAEDLLKQKESFHEENYYTAGYDSPFKLLGRTNEVWFVKKNSTNNSGVQTTNGETQKKE